MKNKSSFLGFGTLWPYLKKYKLMFIRMIIMGMMVSSVDAIYPLFNRYAIDHFIAYKTLDTLPMFIALFVVFALAQAVVNYFNVLDCSSIELYINRDLRNNAFEHLQDVSLSYYNQNSVGYIHARVMSDTGKIGQMASWRLMDIIWFGSNILFSMIVMLIVNWKLAIWVILIVPMAALSISYFQKKLLILNRDIREQNSKITSNINEGITGVKSIKSLVIEDKMNRHFRDDTVSMYRKSLRAAHFDAMFNSTVAMLTSIALGLVIWKGGALSAEHMIEIGTLSIFMSYAMGMLFPIQTVVSSISQIVAIRVNIERYVNLLNVEGEVRDSEEVIKKYGTSFEPKYENFEKLNGDVEFENVSFQYPDGDELVLENFNLKVPKGCNVAIVGETGAGKSTLVNLVCRFFEPTKGRVLIDGEDIKARSLKWLHSNIGYVLQTPFLFSGTVRDNLRYGKEDISDEKIMESLSMIGADSIVNKLKDGLDSNVGESGDMLSTGEKQLLSIARALLADPKILILDEATASIDTVTEKIIQNAVSKLIKGRTSFVIAHRLSTIVNSDVILVVNEGKIVEQGNHKSLMKARGEYYNLYTRQYEELLIDSRKEE
ncbi:MAG: ABC transporter ATP-binding protein/permease [Lachnospiraceae bacterium]|nr:ABC transporter ATP-binding protein/permease [Lachnospiraceae bacterium]